MNNSTNRCDEDCNKFRENLTLKLTSRDSPFTLSENEKRFLPDDWAWLFLRLNKDYRLAYDNYAKKDQESKISKYLLQKPIGNIHEDHDGECRRKFGLAAWLSPLSISLPKLKNKDDSWFAPLKSAIPQDHSRKVIDSILYIQSGPHFFNRNEHPHYRIQETPFGHTIAQLPSQIHSEKRKLPHQKDTTNRQDPLSIDGYLAFAIDCSVPPDGQVECLRALANRLRSMLMEDRITTIKELNQPIIQAIEDCDIFKGIQFKMAKGATDEAKDYKALWRSVYLSSLGAIVSQTETILSELKDVYIKLQDEGLAKCPKKSQFMVNLESSKDTDGEYRNGGNYLKCLLIISELVMKTNDDNLIAQIIGANKVAGSYENIWRRQLHESIHSLKEKAESMVNGGYRQLIYAQKPDVT